MKKYMTFIIGENFIDTMQFMNSSLEKLVKNYPEDKTNPFSQEFCEKLMQQKRIHLPQYMNSF